MIPIKPSVRTRPCAASSPRPCTSESVIRRPASFWPPLTMPNSAACLIELVVSRPALARPMIFAFELCACSRKEEKSDEFRAREPSPPPCRPSRDDVAGVLFQRIAEGVVRGQEEPGVAAGIRPARRRCRPRARACQGPVEAVGRAGVASDARGRGADHDVDLLLLAWTSSCTASATDEVVSSVIMSTPSASYQRRAIEVARSGLFWWSAVTISIFWPSTSPPKSSIAIRRLRPNICRRSRHRRRTGRSGCRS